MSQHPGPVLWLTGRPASGKTTLAQRLVTALRSRGLAVLWLDSDDLRPILTPTPTYADEERDWFYGAIGHIAKRAALGGAAVVVSATAPKIVYRDNLRAAVPFFMEVFLSCSEAELRRRDHKGLYAAAERGEAPHLPGVGIPYEAPAAPELTIHAETHTPIAMTDMVMRWVDAHFASVSDGTASYG